MSFYPYSNNEFDTWIAFNVVWVVELFWNVKNAYGFLVQGLRAERRIGEFSRDLPKNYGRYQQTSHDGESDKTSILKEAGITHCERYEAIASLPDEVLERYIQAETCPRINGDGV